MAPPRTVGALKDSGGEAIPVKEEMRRNLIRKLKAGETLFPGIVGYDKTVLPALRNAVLARHDFILLGLRGQAKSRILRGLTALLDEWLPVVDGCEINDDPFAPICKRCRRLAEEMGDRLPVSWIGREKRYREKLATPDVTMADLIGDIDPIKAANERRSLSDEEVIHFGIIPRTNRGIFAINELPDLQTRIQVGLLNIMEERDVQIRGFPVRLPLDVCIVYSANPEDYTNRGTIITPLRDRIDSQILTHYPETLEDAMAITAQEAWAARTGAPPVRLPRLVRELVESVAFAARRSEFVDQSSGVSARLSIAALESVISNAEQRGLLRGEEKAIPRVCDLYAALPGVTGKIELVYEGEQQGMVAVGKRVLADAVREVFLKYFPNAKAKPEKPRRTSASREPAGRGSKDPAPEETIYKSVLDWFAQGNRVELTDTMPSPEYAQALDRVQGLRELAAGALQPTGEAETALAMEFVLEGMHQLSLVAREELGAKVSYRDMLKQMFESMET
ncbi:MAG: magnesium chelatase [Planctomycetes bacterium]|nr:magnesium chelatase [Planctomycetota bacterium]